MRILIITQNEPFFLAKNLSFLIDQLKKHEIVACAITPVSPFGKKESFLKKALKTISIFGKRFFIFYSLKFIYSKLFTRSVYSTLQKLNVKSVQIQGSINSKENLRLFKNLEPDLIISILGNQIFKKNILELAPKGCINLHTALLPKYRGLLPTFWVMKNNEEFTGVSVFYMDEGIDSGPIIAQKRIKIGNKSQLELIQETKKIGMQLLLQSIELIANNKVKTIDNLDSMKTYYSFPTKKDVRKFRENGKKFF